MENTRYQNLLCPFANLEKCAGCNCILFNSDPANSHSSNCLAREACRWLAENNNASHLLTDIRNLLASKNR